MCIGQHHFAHHFPCGATQTIGRLAQDGRHDFEHVTHHRGNEGQHHEGEHNASGQNANAVHGTAKKRPDQRHLPQRGLNSRLPVLGKQRRKNKQAEHAVNDGRHRRQQLDGRAQRAAQGHRAVLGQEQRNAKRQRHRNQQRNGGTGQRAKNGNGSTKLFVDDVPLDAPDEFEAKLLKRRQGIGKQRHDDAQQCEQHHQRERLRHAVKHHILQPLLARNGGHVGVIRLCGYVLHTHDGFHTHIRLQISAEHPRARLANRPALCHTAGRVSQVTCC